MDHDVTMFLWSVVTAYGVFIVAINVFYAIRTPGSPRQKPVAQRREPRVRKSIPRAVQEEIDQTPEWWDREFRRLQGLSEPSKIQTSPSGIGYIPTRGPRGGAGNLGVTWLNGGEYVMDMTLTSTHPMAYMVDNLPPSMAELIQEQIAIEQKEEQ